MVEHLMRFGVHYGQLPRISAAPSSLRCGRPHPTRAFWDSPHACRSSLRLCAPRLGRVVRYGDDAAPMTPEGVGNFGIDSLIVDGQAVLRLSGDLDMDSAERFGEAARRVHAEGIRCLVLDLSSLDFVDSSGLSQFVLALKRQREIGGEVVLQAPTDPVKRVLEIAGMNEIFAIT